MSPTFHRRRRVVGVCLAVALVGLLAVGSVGAVIVGPTGPGDTTDALAQQANEPPNASFEYAPENPQIGETIALNATGSSDPDGEIVEYRWDLDGDDQTDANGPNQRVAFPRAGTYPVRLTVVDADGATDTVTRSIVVAGDQPPVAQLTVTPETVTVGETVTLDPTGSSDPDGQIVTWEYDTNGSGTFDETFDSPTTLRTGFGQPGTYEVTLRVTDTDGMTATATVTVVVEPASPTASPTAATPAGEADTPAGGADGADGVVSGGAFPWRLAIGAGVVLLLLVAIGGVVAARGGGMAGGRGWAGATLGRLFAALVLVLVLLVGPALLIGRRFGGAPAGGAEISIGLLQLAALYLPTLVLLVWLLFRFVDQRETRSRPGPVVGPLTGDQFRWVAVAFGFVSSVLAVLGVVGILAAAAPSYPVLLAGGMIIAAVAVVPLAFAFVLVNLSLG